MVNFCLSPTITAVAFGVVMITANRQPQNTSSGMKCYHGDFSEKLIDWVTALVQLQTQLSNYTTTSGQNRQEK